MAKKHGSVHEHADYVYSTKRIDGKLHMICSNTVKGCTNWVPITAKSGVTAVMCWRCLAAKVPFPMEALIPQHLEYPKGWNMMKEFVDIEGNVYRKGVMQLELKGTLPPTDITVKEPTKTKPRKVDVKDEYDKLMGELGQLKMQYKRASKTEKSAIERQLNAVDKKIQQLRSQHG